MSSSGSVRFLFARCYRCGVNRFVNEEGIAGIVAWQKTMVMLVARNEMQAVSLGTISLTIVVSPFGSLLVGDISSVPGTA